MFITDNTAKQDCKMVLGALRFKRNYFSHSKSGLPIVIVEGAIDRTFYNLHKQDNVLFITISELSKNAQLKESEKVVNNNVLIAEVLYSIQSGSYSTGECKGDFYGIIDKDFEEPDSIVFTIPNLFVTDTHDLETALLSSDDGLLRRMGIDLTDESYQDAILLSYEFGLIREYLYSNELFKVKNLLDADAAIDFSLFTTNKELDVHKVFDYLNSLKTYPLKGMKIEEQICGFVNRHSQLVSGSGVFTIKNSQYRELILRNPWDRINGHDFCSALRFLSDEALRAYPPAVEDNKRYMESVMVMKYDFINFRKLGIGKKMRNAALLRG